MPRTAFTEVTGCSVPLQQAPMGPISPPELAVAVANAGGVGTIAAMGLSPDQIVALSERMRASTGGVLAANFLTDDIDPDAVDAAAARFRIVDFFWRDPDRALIRRVHAGGALALWQVGSVAEARAAVSAGADILAAQGTEAGGHVRGHTALLPLLSAVCDEVTVPVLAAGGIATARAVRAVLAAGAAGVRVGTRFIASTESGAHPGYVAALLAAGEDSTEITAGFAKCPLCVSVPRARVLRSAIDAVGELAFENAGRFRQGTEMVPLPAHAGLPPYRDVEGRIDAMALYAGESAGAVREVRDAADIVAELMGG
ncbi:nitronate monooxygenase [Amycolatopsis sp. K13G38]|uniref:Nitronate monooxygenase n=1 Tax=Amycolatopsis acididurans TaxID=2724524 RepID=A0ABX1J1C0_9PSEU|nr:nitronate monooxygenase [Amycolatopsis acididurans]NKQ53571.1 nitronate monooxygenase [Amycolatopsis acididurans]